MMASRTTDMLKELDELRKALETPTRATPRKGPAPVAASPARPLATPGRQALASAEQSLLEASALLDGSGSGLASGAALSASQLASSARGSPAASFRAAGASPARRARYPASAAETAAGGLLRTPPRPSQIMERLENLGRAGTSPLQPAAGPLNPQSARPAGSGGGLGGGGSAGRYRSELNAAESNVERLSRAMEAAEDELEMAFRRTGELHRGVSSRREAEVHDLRKVIQAKDSAIDSLRETLSSTRLNLEGRLGQAEALLASKEGELWTAKEQLTQLKTKTFELEKQAQDSTMALYDHKTRVAGMEAKAHGKEEELAANLTAITKENEELLGEASKKQAKIDMLQREVVKMNDRLKAAELRLKEQEIARRTGHPAASGGAFGSDAGMQSPYAPIRRAGLASPHPTALHPSRAGNAATPAPGAGDAGDASVQLKAERKGRKEAERKLEAELKSRKDLEELFMTLRHSSVDKTAAEELRHIHAALNDLKAASPGKAAAGASAGGEAGAGRVGGGAAGGAGRGPAGAAEPQDEKQVLKEENAKLVKELMEAKGEVKKTMDQFRVAQRDIVLRQLDLDFDHTSSVCGNAWNMEFEVYGKGGLGRKTVRG